MPDFSKLFDSHAQQTFAPMGTAGDSHDGIGRVVIDSCDPTIDPDNYNRNDLTRHQYVAQMIRSILFDP